MRDLTIEEVLELHRLVITQSGGGSGVRDPRRLRAASWGQTEFQVNLKLGLTPRSPVRFCQLDPDVQEIMRLTRVEGLFSIFANEQDARDSFLSL